MRQKRWLTMVLLTLTMSLIFGMTALAATWRTGAEPNQDRWWFDYEDGTYARGGWQWLDGNQDGIAECYYFDSEGWMAAGTTTPDGYEVDQNGAWISGGVVQTRQNDADGSTEPSGDTHILIAYYSRTNTTEEAAQIIGEQTGGTLFEIQPENPYPSGYSATTQRAQQEINAGVLPTLSSDVENFEQYDTILIGYPIWWGVTPPVVNTFMNNHDFTGKTVIPFCTSGGSGISGSLTDVRQYCEGAEIRSGRDLTGVDANGIYSWLSELGIAR